ncbi:DTW domain-containing protein [Actinidia rufa]|uniref:tRNA-uridine aminocarboxypropyltransferase n=1 Tax=Actinidia rufa TaxID=165716 RepID=A0A7J0G2D0_9ERIC|nr:DTW domain-containing protein [Actinidia rufa]
MLLNFSCTIPNTGRTQFSLLLQPSLQPEKTTQSSTSPKPIPQNGLGAFLQATNVSFLPGSRFGLWNPILIWVFLGSNRIVLGSCGKPQNPEGFMDHLVTENQCLDSDSEMGFHGSESNCTGSCEKPQNSDGFCFTIRKSGVISSFMGHLVTEDPSFDLLLASSGDLSNGFVVKKWKSTERQEIEEFEIRVPSGSVLLFPSERSVGIEAIDFEVKNLIVLDGTWAKAKRVYSENPWLKLLPHVKLDLGKMSLYGEVRNQPRAGYLSTIESIVYALKAVGDETDGLENLLEVFESMVGDQRRCKDERLSKIVLG